MKKISFILALILTLGICSNALAYYPRLNAPEKDNAFYTSLNPFYTSGYGMTDKNIGNCTCYAFGRSYENIQSYPSLSLSDAYKWYDYNIKGGYYPYSSDITMPAPGAVAVWQKRGTSWGHVAVVEKVNQDSVITSESGWEQYYFKTLERSMDDPSLGQEDYDFLGYIYVCGRPIINTAPKAVRNLRSRDREYALGETIDFSWNMSYGTDSYWAYVWHNGAEISGTRLLKSTEFSFTPQSAGEYKLIVNAVNNHGFEGSVYEFSVKADGSVWKSPYDDVIGNDWYYDAVKYVSANNIMNGMVQNAFNPSGELSRGMLAAILYRMEGSPESGALNYIDVPKDSYYAAAVAWADSLGITKGMSEGLFYPDLPVSREQLITMLHRYMEYKKSAPLIADADISAYFDHALIDEYARGAFSFALANGIISGDEAGRLSPDKTASRAEIAQILLNSVNKIQ